VSGSRIRIAGSAVLTVLTRRPSGIRHKGPCDTGGSGCNSMAWAASNLSARTMTELAEAMSVVARVAPVDDAVSRRQRWAGGT
jgi:hypothetical protein